MKKRIFIIIVCGMVVAVLPAIFFYAVLGKLSINDSVIAVATAVALLNFSRRKGRRVFAVEMIGTFVASLAMCMVLSLWTH